MSGRADFAERRVIKVERLRARAEKLGREGAAALSGARRISDMIPFGQPVLVGHHSEKRHRRDLARIDNGFRKGFAALDAAKKLVGRAASAESSRAISSDDPSAAGQIRAKIAKLEQDIETMKAANKIVRMAKGDNSKATEGLRALGFSPATAAQIVAPDFAGRIGFPGYKLTNDGAEVRRLKKRLIALDAAESRSEIPDEQIGNVVLREASNRTQLLFPGKPSEQARHSLKSSGFRWAPSEGAWQRMSSEQARRAARAIAKLYGEEK